MKRLFLIPIPLCVCLPLAAGESMIRFANGDHVTGSMVALEAEQLVWDSPLFAHPCRFLTAQTLSVLLPPHAPQGPTQGHEITVAFTNGDQIRGQLAEVSAERVMIDTWFAGRLALNRRMVDNATIEEAAPIRYRGPNSMDDWVCAPRSNPWKYASFAFHSLAPGSIAKADALHDSSSLTFDAEWDADALSLKVVLFSPDPTTRNPESGCEIRMNRGSVILRNCADQSFLGSTHSTVLAQSNRARIEIRANRLTGKVAVLINDQLLDVWQSENFKMAPPSHALHFITDDASSIRISGIRIAEWDGEIDQPIPAQAGFRPFQLGRNAPPTEVPAAEKTPAPGRMQLNNGDSLEGKVTSIQDGKVTIETSLGAVTLPVQRLRTIALPPAPREEAYRWNGDVRAWMPDGASIVFRLDSVDHDTITGTSDHFGTATFRRDAFQRIDFNLYEIDYDDLRKESKW